MQDEILTRLETDLKMILLSYTVFSLIWLLVMNTFSAATNRGKSYLQKGRLAVNLEI
jgi:hypothetical protein